MTTCSVRWRPSGGRGEFEFVPADSLLDRDISVDFEALSLRISAEVYGVNAQGKPRLRKHESNNRRKLHLPQLVMAIAGLPEPAREDKGRPVRFPLENKQFVMDEMDFDIVEDDGMSVVLAPLRVSVLHSDFQVQLGDRLDAIARDWSEIDRIRGHDPKLADAIDAHRLQIRQGTNSNEIRKSADGMIRLKSKLFGQTNAGSATTLIEAAIKPEVEAEEIVGREGRLLVRLHVYRERDRTFVRRVRKHYRSLAGGRLVCNACGSVPIQVYGPSGESCMEAHHKVPIEQLQPDSVTLVGDMVMLCASCHRVVHSEKPCLTVEKVNELVVSPPAAARRVGMTDKIDPARRSRNMSRIKGQDTKPEMTVRRLLHRMGYRYRLHRKDLPGKPDIVFGPRRKAIFVHGCFLARAFLQARESCAEIQRRVLGNENSAQRRTPLRPTRPIDRGWVDGAHAMGVRACQRGCGRTAPTRFPRRDR